MKFEWDKNKAASNEQKHGVSFDEAQTAFAGFRYRSTPAYKTKTALGET